MQWERKCEAQENGGLEPGDNSPLLSTSSMLHLLHPFSIQGVTGAEAGTTPGKWRAASGMPSQVPRDHGKCILLRLTVSVFLLIRRQSIVM